MKKIKVIDISKKLGVTHSAASQWLSGATKPTADKMFLIEDFFGIPLSAWRDIKSYLKNDTRQDSDESNTTNERKVS